MVDRFRLGVVAGEGREEEEESGSDKSNVCADIYSYPVDLLRAKLDQEE